MFLTLAVVVSTTTVQAQFRFPFIPKKQTGYIVIDSVDPDEGKLLRALDANGDGNLSPAEISNAPSTLRKLDRDKDGNLSPLEIKPTPSSETSQGFNFTTEFGLTRFNCDDLQEILGTQKIVSQRITKGTASYANYAKDGLGIRRKAEVRIIGTTTGLAKVLNLQMKAGRFLEKRDNDYFDSVATIGPDVASRLFPGENPIGKHLRMTHDTSNFHSIIVGVLKDKNQGNMSVYIPQNTMKERIGDLEIDRSAGIYSAKKCEVNRAWIPVMNAKQARPMMTKVSNFLHLRDRPDLKVEFKP